MAYAIVRTGGKQFRVTEGEVIKVPTIDAEVGASVDLEALLEGDGEAVNVAPDGRTVKATVVEHGLASKVIVFRKKRRKGYKKTRGHRQGFTAVRIESFGT